MPSELSKIARLSTERALDTDSRWDQQWSRVPAPWREGRYRLDQEPFVGVFTRNSNYLKSKKEYSFIPVGVNPRLGQEMAWWVWTCWAEGWRKVEPSMLRWWSEAIIELVARTERFSSRTVTSISELAPEAVLTCAIDLFMVKNGREPSPGNRRNIKSIADHIHMLVSGRCTEKDWWEAEAWHLRVDPRIPRRAHEPCADQIVNIGIINPHWLREGVRFWLHWMLTYDQFTWTTATTRARNIGTYYGKYCLQRGISHPAVTTDPEDLHEVFTDFLTWLQSSERSVTGKILGRNQVSAIQSHVQSFYSFMLDNKNAATKATNNPVWARLTANHTRLWPMALRSRNNRHESLSGAGKWMSAQDLALMVCHLPVLAAPTEESAKVTLPDGTRRDFPGIGDAPAMRAWLIQAMTGRRVSEILMLDFEPLTMLCTPEEQAAADSDAFIARLRYQQTKVDGVDPTIMVEQAVVTLIRDQQNWVREKYPEAAKPPYLFPAPRHNHKGTQARTRSSLEGSLKRLDTAVNLADTSGQALKFTKTHRLRHTRATELLNAGVPQHVVQRYMGHRSPEMTMHYAATLAQTAENEFLKYKKVGIDGKDIDLSPQDVYDMTMLNKRTDRILPNGVCLLPPSKTCDKGNACLSCGHFATDRRHIDDLQEQREQTLALIQMRREQHHQRTGQDLGEDNIWVTGRRAEISVLDSIIARLETETDHATSVAGPGIAGRTRLPITPVTSGAHRNLLTSAPALAPQRTGP